MPPTTLRDLVVAALSNLKDRIGTDQEAIFDALGLPLGDGTADTKRTCLESRMAALDAAGVREVAQGYVRQFPLFPGRELSFEIEEALWVNAGPGIPKKFRHETAKRLGSPLCGYSEKQALLKALSRLFLLQTFWQGYGAALGESDRDSVKAKIEAMFGSYFGIGPGHEELFNVLGAFDVSHRRFALLLEALASAEIRPDEAEQRKFVALANDGLRPCGVELRESGEEDGYPVFQLVAIGGVSGKLKNIIFASAVKPDLRFTDTLNGEIGITSNADKVLVYDRPLPTNEPLRWRDLQAWWAESQGIGDESAAKTSLHKRLRESLPTNSPPQQLLFEAYHRVFSNSDPNLPALLPEVWLCWDPKTVRERGRDALLRFRMDFLLLLSGSRRIVIEVDGVQHYSEPDDRGRPVVGSSRVDLQACKLEYSIVSPK